MKDKEQSKAEMKTAEEFINPLVFPDEIVIDTLGEDIQFVSKNDAIQAVKDYHKQFKSQQSVITEEMIEKEVDRRIEHIYAGYANRALRSGMIDMAKWAIEKQRTNDRELLNTFIKEIKDEFRDENWNYLDFIADRVLNGK